MAFDGIAVAALVRELDQTLRGGIISRIVQPEKDALVFTVKQYKNTYKLYISASASLPLVYLTEENFTAPITAPAFSMLLRKYLQNGRILSVTQPSLERVLVFSVEHRDEMGDLSVRRLMVEIMGKYSNAILVDDTDTIIDAIKRIPASVSSVREVLTGRPYFIPDALKKENPLEQTEDSFFAALTGIAAPLSKALSLAFTGISYVSAEEIVYRAGLDGGQGAPMEHTPEAAALYAAFTAFTDRIKAGDFAPVIVYRKEEPVEFGAFPFTIYGNDENRAFPSMSAVLMTYYAQKNRVTLLRQKSASMRHVAQTALGRAERKYELQKKQLSDTEKADTFRLYGELLQVYGYDIPDGSKKAEVDNYYTGEKIVIPLKEEISPLENSKRYFARYNKLKRTRTQLSSQIVDTKNEIARLDAILTSIDLAETEADLRQVRREMSEAGFIRQEKADGKRGKAKGKESSHALPMCYRSSDGYLLYVGKNNLQNEEVTFKIGDSDDLWFHAKGCPGSHVIAKTGGTPLDDLPDRLFEEAGALAAFYSKNKNAGKVEIDYTPRRNLKRPPAGTPGFVIYHTNYSLIADTDISMLRRVE